MVIVFDYATMRTIPLIYEPDESILYLYYNIFGFYLLGSYIPNPGICVVFTGKACVPIAGQSVLGFRPGTGTSQ